MRELMADRPTVRLYQAPRAASTCELMTDRPTGFHNSKLIYKDNIQLQKLTLKVNMLTLKVNFVGYMVTLEYY